MDGVETQSLDYSVARTSLAPFPEPRRQVFPEPNLVRDHWLTKGPPLYSSLKPISSIYSPSAPLYSPSTHPCSLFAPLCSVDAFFKVSLLIPTLRTSQGNISSKIQASPPTRVTLLIGFGTPQHLGIDTKVRPRDSGRVSRDTTTLLLYISKS